MLLLNLLLCSIAMADIKPQVTNKLIKSCADINISNTSICSKAIISKTLEDRSFELTENLLEKLDVKGIAYDNIKVSNSSQYLECKNTDNHFQLKVCVDKNKINNHQDKETAFLVEDLF